MSGGCPQSPARPAVGWAWSILFTKPFAEGIGVRRIGEAESDVVLFVVMPPSHDFVETVKQSRYRRKSNDTPSVNAFCCVAPGVRLSDFAIFATGTFLTSKGL